jgi:hypothetical protein
VPDDEIERLRSVLARAHEKPPRFPRSLFQSIKDRLSTRIQKKAIVERIETRKDKDAA